MYRDPQSLPLLLALPYWLITVGGLTLIIALVSIFSLVLNHRGQGIGIFLHELEGCAKDVFSLSLRRVWALSKLTFVEAYRRKALAVFVVFALLFMFAGWFMGGDSSKITNDQVKVYISFVLRTITWLTMPLVLVLSSFGIPEDIRVRSLHTVVTKPARRLEVVLGRVIGFSMIGTLVLLVMSVVGWIWIVRQIPASAKDVLICRVPVWGELKFLDRDGNPGKGLNVGDLWEYRSYIEGATKARAIWTFQNVSERTLDNENNLHLENQFLAFRSYKGDMNRSLLYDYQFRNPETNLTYTTRAKPINENRGVTDVIPRELKVPGEEKSYDLIRDFVTKDGTLTVEVSCIDREQYLGMAMPDLFIRMPDRPFIAGFFKAVLGIELLMILVVLLGVSASTFLKGPIATVLTAVLAVLGGEESHKFMDQLVIGRADPKGGFQGGGFFESIYRIIMHMNPTTELPDNVAFKAMQGVDSVLTGFLWLCKQVIPQLKYFDMTDVANGFDITWQYSLIPSLLVTLGYLVPCVLLGYFALRIRELESK